MPAGLLRGSIALLLVSTVISSPQAAASHAAGHDPTDPQDAGTVRVIAQPDQAPLAGEMVARMTLREKAGSVVMGHIPTMDPAVLADYMATTEIGGFLLMGANIPADEAALRALTAALTVDPSLPPLIAVDQEGGDVSRLPWDTFPAANTLKSLPPSATRDAFAGRSALLERAGIGVNFGIVADTTADPSMFIYRRSLGTTPDAAAAGVVAAVEGESSRAVSTLKHFPGHGAAPGDSHSGIPTTSLTAEQWHSADAVPFAAGIDAGAGMLMFGHLAYAAVDPLPATLSQTWHRIAREELGFSGIAITDDLGMLEASGDPAYADPVANAIAAITAGNDMVLTVVYSTPELAGQVVDGIVSAVEAGAIPEARLDEAAVRVAQARLEQAALGRSLVPCAACAPAS